MGEQEAICDGHLWNAVGKDELRAALAAPRDRGMWEWGLSSGDGDIPAVKVEDAAGVSICV